jgi:hypothetical protein
MSRNMDFHDEYVYRVVEIRERSRDGRIGRTVSVCGPYSTLGVAKSAMAREKGKQYSWNGERYTTYIQRSKLMWEDA